MLVSGLNESARIAHQEAKSKGFWDKEDNLGEKLMLIVSELGEALEAHRKQREAKLDSFMTELWLDGLDPAEFEEVAQGFDDKLYKETFEKYMKDTVSDEIADTFIRLLDLCGGLNIDIEAHINSKFYYNKLRPRLHGKNY